MFCKNFRRWIATLLCVSLCVVNPTANVSASPSVSQNYENTKENIIEETSEDMISDTTETQSSEIITNEIETQTADNTLSEEYGSETITSEPESESIENESSEMTTLESDSSEDTTSEIETESEFTETETESMEDTSSETESIEDTSSETETESTEDVFTETETETFESTEFETESIEVDSSKELLIETAVAAFNELLNEKTLMALLYHTESYEVKHHAGSYNDTVATINSGHTLYIKGVEILNEQVWYNTHFWLNGEEKSGYIEGYYLAYSDEDWISWEKEYLASIYEGSTTYGITAYSTFTGNTDTSDISAFPALYQDSLKALKDQHPNWTFVPMNTGLDFNTAVSSEMGVKSLIQNTKSNASKGWVGDPCPTESGWYYATKPAVSHYMNPLNFLSETYIFQFEQLTFNSSYHNTSAIQSFLNNTFMKGKIPGDSESRSYAQAFYDIGKNRKLSPIHLASRVYQEQGSGNSALISGTYKGYEGYYNYFNVGVNGSSTEEKIIKGLTYAKNKGWNTRFKSLEGGAATIGNNYILKGQDTGYLQKFNVDSNSPHGLYNHQYMQNIQAPASESISTKKMYANSGSINSGFVFKIPVFKNMPGEKAIQNISLDKTEVLLYRPDTIIKDPENMPSSETLTVSFTPADTTDDTTITWSSSNSNIVSVKADKNTTKAVITATGAGEATITAKSVNGKTAKCKVKVEAPIYSLTLVNLNTVDNIPETSASIYAGQTLTLTADYMPKNTTSDTTITWSSSNPEIASVTAGKVKALSNGKTVISASVADFTATFELTVKSGSVKFMSQNYSSVLKEIPIKYGDALTEDVFPVMENTTDKTFIGWYTDKNGLGTRYNANTPIYSNSLTLYPYFEEEGKGFYVIPVGDQTYTGTAIKPEVKVYDSVKLPDGNIEQIELVKGKDYTVSYKNNKNVNTSSKNVPTITVKGKGNYKGTSYTYFNITPKSLEDNDITTDNITVAYNKKTQKLSPSIYRNGKKLTNKKDYTLTYPHTSDGSYKNAGVYPIIIKGKGNYTGTVTVYETISNKTMLNKVSISQIPNQVYKNELVDKENNIGIIPDKLNVTYKGEPLKEGVDYTVTYANNMSVGTATATITAIDNSSYAGSKSIKYKIVGASINKSQVTGVTSKIYTGNEADVLQNNASLTFDGKTLKENKDYTVTYTNISKVGTATVLFKGINEYSGQLKKTYKITPYVIDNGSNAPSLKIKMAYYTENKPSILIPVSNKSEISTPYMKGKTKLGIKLYYNNIELIQNKDYTVKYANNSSITTSETPENKLPKLTIKGKGNFKGSFYINYSITDGEMSDSNGKLTMQAKDIVYKNKAGNYKTTITITDANGAKLSASKDYDRSVIYTYTKNNTKVTLSDGSVITRNAGDVVNSKDIINAGTTIKATIKGIGAYVGNGTATLSTTYRIIASNISKAKVKADAKVYQNGRPVTLTKDDLTVTLNGIPLEYNKDYIIDTNTYNNNIKKGKASVIIRGIGSNYGGEKKITFTISSKTLAWWKNL